MNKQVKAFLVIAGIAAVGYFVWKAKNSARQTTNTGGGNSNGGGNAGNCPVGEIPCSTGTKCYNPSINYFQDPCN